MPLIIFPTPTAVPCQVVRMLSAQTDVTPPASATASDSGTALHQDNASVGSEVDIPRQHMPGVSATERATVQ